VLSGRHRLLLLVGLAARKQPSRPASPLQTHAPLTLVQPVARRLLHREATPIEGDRISGRFTAYVTYGAASSVLGRRLLLLTVSIIRSDRNSGAVVRSHCSTTALSSFYFLRQKRCMLACVGAWPFLFHISTHTSTAVVAVEETVCFLFLPFSFFYLPFYKS
jgi:hypothetical protein